MSDICRNTACLVSFTAYIRAHAVLLSPFSSLGKHAKLRVERAWETRRGDWRRLRHDRALVCFRADLRAPNFTNPPQRVTLFREFKEGQALRHDKRVALLRDLCGRRPVDAAAARAGGSVDEDLTVREGARILFVAAPGQGASNWVFRSNLDYADWQ